MLQFTRHSSQGVRVALVVGIRVRSMEFSEVLCIFLRILSEEIIPILMFCQKYLIVIRLWMGRHVESGSCKIMQKGSWCESGAM